MSLTGEQMTNTSICDSSWHFYLTCLPQRLGILVTKMKSYTDDSNNEIKSLILKIKLFIKMHCFSFLTRLRSHQITYTALRSYFFNSNQRLILSFSFQSKVFEVNCSSQRSGRHVLSQLKEATQSHLVETQGKDPLKPAYLSNSSCAPKPEPYPGRRWRYTWPLSGY